MDSKERRARLNLMKRWWFISVPDGVIFGFRQTVKLTDKSIRANQWLEQQLGAALQHEMINRSHQFITNSCWLDRPVCFVKFSWMDERFFFIHRNERRWEEVAGGGGRKGGEEVASGWFINSSAYFDYGAYVCLFASTCISDIFCMGSWLHIHGFFVCGSRCETGSCGWPSQRHFSVRFPLRVSQKYLTWHDINLSRIRLSLSRVNTRKRPGWLDIAGFIISRSIKRCYTRCIIRLGQVLFFFFLEKFISLWECGGYLQPWDVFLSFLAEAHALLLQDLHISEIPGKEREREIFHSRWSQMKTLLIHTRARCCTHTR